MGYYARARGDFYGQGDFYFRPGQRPRGDMRRRRRGRGDLWDSISGAVGGLVSNVLPLASGAAGALVGGPFGASIGAALGTQVRNLFGGGPSNPVGPYAATSPASQFTVPVIPPKFRNTGSRSLTTAGATNISLPSTAGLVSPADLDAALAGGAGVDYSYPSRRMNVLNPSALRRALRRTRGFLHVAQKFVKMTGTKKHVDGYKPKFFKKAKKRA